MDTWKNDRIYNFLKPLLPPPLIVIKTLGCIIFVLKIIFILRQMRRMCEESKDMGLKCMGLLENQGESIENWEDVAEGINKDMVLAEKALKDMDRACFGFIPRFWKIGGGFKEDDAVWCEPEQPKNDCLPDLKGLNADHCFVSTSEESGEQNEKEKEMEENMNEVNVSGKFNINLF